MYTNAYHHPELGITGKMYRQEFTKHHVREYFRSLTTDGHRLFLALDSNANILGGAVGRNVDLICELKAGYVRTDLQGQGIGTQLLGKLQRLAGSRDLVLDVVWYSRVIRWYRELGFRETGEVVVYPWRDPRLQAAFGIKMILKAC